MFGECHAHLFMDGIDYHAAVRDHKDSVNIKRVREHLQAYQDSAVPFVRDGGDRFGVSEKARELAPEYGIAYYTPIFAIHREGHYGRIVGKGVQTLNEYRERIAEVRQKGGDFIKIMVSGIMDYRDYGLISEEALDEEWITQMIHIAHAEGFSVMVHANGREAVLPAVLAGADSIEHGNYIDRDCIEAMAKSDCVWVPTIVTTKNLLGCGRYDDEILKRIYEMECRNLAAAYEAGVHLALGSDAGAYLVPHGRGLLQEQEIFYDVLSNVSEKEIQRRLEEGETLIKEKMKSNV